MGSTERAYHEQALVGVVVLTHISVAFTRHLPHEKPVRPAASAGEALAAQEGDPG